MRTLWNKICFTKTVFEKFMKCCPKGGICQDDFTFYSGWLWTLQMFTAYNRIAIKTSSDVPVLIPVFTYGLTPWTNCGSGFAELFVENIHIAIQSRIQEFFIVFFNTIFIFVVNLRYLLQRKYIICLQIGIISPFLIRSNQLIGEFR